MREHRPREFLHVVGDDELPSAREREGLRAFDEPQAAPGARAVADLRIRARRADERRDVLAHRRRDSNPAPLLLQLDDALGARHGRKLDEGVVHQKTVQNQKLLVPVGVAEVDLHEEAVELGLGQGKGAVHLDGILRRDHEEGPRQVDRVRVDRHLELAHALEEARLRAGNRAVDLVRQEHVAHHGAGVKHELPRLLAVDRKPRHVRGQEVRRELNAAELPADAPSQRLRHQRLAQARHILQEHMSARQQRHRHELERPPLAHHHLRRVVDDGGGFILLRHAGNDSTARGVVKYEICRDFCVSRPLHSPCACVTVLNVHGMNIPGRAGIRLSATSVQFATTNSPAAYQRVSAAITMGRVHTILIRKSSRRGGISKSFISKATKPIISKMMPSDNIKPLDSIYIYHITHIDNLDSIVESGGLFSQNRLVSPQKPIPIGMEEVKHRRTTRPVDCYPGTFVADYVPYGLSGRKY